jgi:SAM-dependent methyltransferase
MRETSKTNQLRGQEFIETYLAGRVVDIGAGDDPVKPGAEVFDLQQGDANRILDFLEPEAYDAVHSSHCLEHMLDPVGCLRQWWGLVKPGGYLVLVVPDEDLYEQGFWPSRFNGDHKATFRMRSSPQGSWSPVSHAVEDLVGGLPGVEWISLELQDQGYDRSLQSHHPPRQIKPRGLFMRLVRSVSKRLPFVGYEMACRIDGRLLVTNGIPIDQTRRGALAQIQAVVRKGKAQGPIVTRFQKPPT